MPKILSEVRAVVRIAKHSILHKISGLTKDQTRVEVSAETTKGILIIGINLVRPTTKERTVDSMSFSQDLHRMVSINSTIRAEVEEFITATIGAEKRTTLCMVVKTGRLAADVVKTSQIGEDLQQTVESLLERASELRSLGRLELKTVLERTFSLPTIRRVSSSSPPLNLNTQIVTLSSTMSHQKMANIKLVLRVKMLLRS